MLTQIQLNNTETQWHEQVLNYKQEKIIYWVIALEIY